MEIDTAICVVAAAVNCGAGAAEAQHCPPPWPASARWRPLLQELLQAPPIDAGPAGEMRVARATTCAVAAGRRNCSLGSELEACCCGKAWRGRGRGVADVWPRALTSRSGQLAVPPRSPSQASQPAPLRELLLMLLTRDDDGGFQLVAAVGHIHGESSFIPQHDSGHHRF